jgi:hypothetical protein
MIRLSISSSPIPFSTPLLVTLSGCHFFPIPLLTLFALTRPSVCGFLSSRFPHPISVHLFHSIVPTPFRLIICLDISSPRLFILLLPCIQISQPLHPYATTSNFLFPFTLSSHLTKIYPFLLPTTFSLQS